MRAHRQLGAALATAWLLTGAPALAAPPVAGAAAASAPATKKPDPLPSCQSGTLPQLTDVLSQLPRESVAPAADLMADNAENAFTYLHPSATGNAEFVAFLAMPDAHYQYKKDGAVLLPVVRVDHPPTDALTSTPVANNQNAYELRLQTPRLGMWVFPDHRALVVFACSNDQPVGYAVRPVLVSSQLGAASVGVALVIVVYLLAATLVYRKRKSDAQHANSIQATPPTRVSEIKPWKWVQCLDPVWMSSDMFDQASLSKLQILFFVLVVSFGVTYSLIRTGALSDLSSSIVFLLGIPALGALGNQAAAVSRDRLSLDNWAWLAKRGVFPLNDPGNDTPRWRDLVMSGAELDLYKLQALMFSLIVGVALIFSGLSKLATFKVPDTLLQILGLSQAVFVGGRLTKPTTLGDLDDLITELRSRAAALKVAVNTGVDVDASGKPLQPREGAPAPGPVQPDAETAMMDAARKAVPTAVSRYEDTEAEVEILLEQMTHRDVKPAGLRDPFLAPAEA